MTESRETPEIQVGIFSLQEIGFTLNGNFIEESSGKSFTGKCIALYSGRKIILKCDGISVESESPMVLAPLDVETSSFTLHAVTIGVDFHWQRKEDQVFKGSIKFLIEENKITAINVLSVEDYLTSVISSEMNATSSEELLKAHAVISRSWLLAQIKKSRELKNTDKKYDTHFESENEIMRWYDREDHTNFDVCADDHCQRYQGITRASSPVVVKAIKATYGALLTYEGSICDTRYYKCCGGVTELFENVWEPVNHPYLRRVTDSKSYSESTDADLSIEEEAVRYIKDEPDVFCNTSDSVILNQVLNDYDQETADFFRWKVTYTREELSELVKTRTGIDFGIIEDLVPVERGVSGRLVRLKIIGTKKTMIIGKELEIRKSLSRSHLYSSCFYIEKINDGKNVVFILHGAGWGHGVGLCQIGAAVMGAEGYSYKEILEHYFPGAVLEKLY
jgi:stage II sporulation protein D